MEHVSWLNSKFNFDELEILQKKAREKPSKYACEYQHGVIPVYDANQIDFNDLNVQTDIYNIYYEYTGVIIIKNLYKENVMNQYNKWCEVRY